MKIIRLTATNVKRIKAVEITPADHVQVVTGRNAQGKTSLMDAIWLAIGGGQASKETARVVRDGEDEASVELDLGDLIVTRTWKGERSKLVVRAADGAAYSSPQSVLDEHMGRLSFDPLAFTRMSPKDQVKALIDVADLGEARLDVLAHERAAAFEQRTDLGRDLKGLGDIPALHPGVPVDEVSVGDLIAQLTAAQHAENARATVAANITRMHDELARLTDRLEKEQIILNSMSEYGDAIETLTEQINSAEDVNARVRENATRASKRERAASLNSAIAQLTQQIDGIDRRREQALSAATFPVDGLGFTDDGVTYNGIPFSQASSSEQIRVSLAMAMSLNPSLRVIRILDGSLLDDESMALIASMAEESDYQVWIERVADDDASAVIIEDGEVIDADDTATEIDWT